MNQQRGGRQTISGIVERAVLIGIGGNNVGDELAKSVEHRHLYRMRIDRRLYGVENPAAQCAGYRNSITFR